MNSWKQEYEKNSPYQWNHCPKCGEDYNLRLIQSSNLPYKIYCTSCGEWIF